MMNGREYIQVFHEFSPVFDEKSKVLILGTFPSVKSREGQFYYHHPQNRFWKVIAALVKEPVPQTVLEKKEMLLRGHIAIWDVVQSCRIKGSSDSSIRDVVPSDLNQILDHAGTWIRACSRGAALPGTGGDRMPFFRPVREMPAGVPFL